VLAGPKIISAFTPGRGTETSQLAAVETVIIPSSTTEVVITTLPPPTEGGEETILPSKEVVETTTLPSPTEPAITVTPTPTAVVYTLVIMTHKDESLVIANRSEGSFPLVELYLEGEDERTLSGAEWEIENLQPDQCVYAVKDKGKTKLPKIECQEVGERLPYEGRDRFWKEEFAIYFNGDKVDICEEEGDKIECWIFIESDD
jgi:hypothetical protein